MVSSGNLVGFVPEDEVVAGGKFGMVEPGCTGSGKEIFPPDRILFCKGFNVGVNGSVDRVPVIECGARDGAVVDVEKGSIKCNREAVAAPRRAIFPVFGGMEG